MAGTQQTKLAKFVAADFRIERIAKRTSSRSKSILTHTTGEWRTIIEFAGEQRPSTKLGDEQFYTDTGH